MSRQKTAIRESVRHNEKIKPFVETLKLSKRDREIVSRAITVLPTNLVQIIEVMLQRQEVLENAVSELICLTDGHDVRLDNHSDIIKKRQPVSWL